MVMSLISYIGTERNILTKRPTTATRSSCRTHPDQSGSRKAAPLSSGDLLATTLPTLFRAADARRL